MMSAAHDCGPPIMDIVVWLRSLGLGKYEAVFRENEIDETVLPGPDGGGPQGAWRHGARVTAESFSAAIAALRNDACGNRPPLTRRAH